MDKETAAYYNDCIARFEEIAYQELSNMIRSKVEYIGTDFLKSKNIQGSTVEEIVENCIKEIKAGGLVGDMAYSRGGGGLLLTFDVKNCIHLPMEARLKSGLRREGGVEPYLCPIANMVLDRILNILKYQMVFKATMEPDPEKNSCVVKCAIYESQDKIGKIW
jgi:hypothetical protein